MIFLSSPVDTRDVDHSGEPVEGGETFVVNDDSQAEAPTHRDSAGKPLPLPRGGR